MYMKKIMMILIAAAIVLPTMAQSFSSGNDQNRQGVGQAPNAPVFQSTSVMQGSGSAYFANPSLNASGTATYNGAEEAINSTTPNNGPRKINPIAAPTPIGDAVLPLLLFAGAFLIWRAARRRAVKE